MKDDFYNLPLRKWPLFDVEARLEHYKKVLKQELKDHGLDFDFHLWISDEWFCPDGVPGFALPAYLFNSQLKRIHRQQAGLIEGRSDREILKLMRHELGHAIDNAFALRANKERQRVFGSSKKEYPDSYIPKVHSKNFVNYLGDQYAQSHPDEDFAETFAYWLDPEKKWHLKSFSKTLHEKLVCMDRLMRGLRGRKPVLKNKFRIEPIEKNNLTPQDYYLQFEKKRGGSKLKRVDHQLRSFFNNTTSKNSQPLAQYLRHYRNELCKKVSREEGVYQYEAKWALDRLIKRAEGLGVQGRFSDFKRKSPTVLRQSFRYLKEKDQLRFYL